MRESHRINLNASTLAEKLSTQLGIPVYHLDLVLWKDNWGHLTEEEFESYHNELITKPEWIIDGVANENSMRTRFRFADSIVFLDVSPHVCKQRAMKRMEDDQVDKNPYMAKGCRYIDVHDLQVEIIDTYESGLKPVILALLSEVPNKNIIQINHETPLQDIVRMLSDQSRSS